MAPVQSNSGAPPTAMPEMATQSKLPEPAVCSTAPVAWAGSFAGETVSSPETSSITFGWAVVIAWQLGSLDWFSVRMPRAWNVSGP